MGTVSATRYHDISTGHRVYGHESKCAHLHGHNYRFHFKVEGAKDSIGRVLDFSVIKSELCMWLEDHWDHKFLVWAKDPFHRHLKDMDPEGVVVVPFNPTAENMAEFMVCHVGPIKLAHYGVTLVSVNVEETAKCSAQFEV
ncbi:MAG: 6-carboxytetrahydropterin synthase [Desulfobacteraceae bacterium]|nr:6-carboxytetrahydropterin synthase [Desulfobacteraceae bacterium]